MNHSIAPPHIPADNRLRATSLNGVWRVVPPVHSDHRGYLFESFRQTTLDAICALEGQGRTLQIVQENVGYSTRHVLRGLHYQLQQAQDKLVTCLRGQILDVVVDLRPGSPSFGQHELFVLEEGNGASLWLPAGCAHGFLTTSELACVSYKMTAYYMPEYERCIAWNDSTLNIQWPGNISPVLSSKDAMGLNWDQAIEEMLTASR